VFAEALEPGMVVSEVVRRSERQASGSGRPRAA
jgi:hypothetical protein